MWDKEFQEKLRKFYSLSDSMDVRRSGRTSVLANILLDIALQSGISIRYDLDHFVDRRGREPSTDELMRRILMQVDAMNKNGYYISINVNRQDSTFTAKYMTEKRLHSFTPILFHNSVFNRESLEKRLQFLNKYKLLLLR